MSLIIDSMLHSPVRNYVIPGLTSWLVGGEGKGVVRMFENEREHQEEITPHSHRFWHHAFVISGEVRQRFWHQHADGDLFQVSKLVYDGEFGKYKLERGDVAQSEILHDHCHTILHPFKGQVVRRMEMKPKARRHEWIINYLFKRTTSQKYTVDVLHSDFVCDYCDELEVKCGMCFYGAPKCPQLGRDLAELEKMGKLVRSRTGVSGVAGMGFPKWVWVYKLP